MSDLHVVLYQPEIPANTGNIIRLCANTGTALHLIHPLGFELDHKKLKRAGLDYHEWVRIKEYQCLNDFNGSINPDRLFAISTRGKQCYAKVRYNPGDAFLFGPETRGLPGDVLERFVPKNRLYLPMMHTSRSLNLSNSVAVVLYEAWRQTGFPSATSNNVV